MKPSKTASKQENKIDWDGTKDTQNVNKCIYIRNSDIHKDYSDSAFSRLSKS